MDEKLKYILEKYPDAKCELNYNSIFQLLIAVSLSAQTTDARVNQTTPSLWERYPSIKDLADASLDEVKQIIKPIGMANTKGKNIVEIAKKIHYEFNDEVPKEVDKLLTLPGVGIKTINVVLAEGFKIPAFPVDTHVNRDAKRLYFATLKDDVNDVERKLKKKIDKELWIQMHHSMIFFGRYFCKAIAPRCNECALKGKCRVNYK